MSMLPFGKGHGTGNDFVIVPDREGVAPLSPDVAVALCDRRTGVGADGVLRVAPVLDVPGAWFMDHYNADGTKPEMCGNGIRVFGRYLVAAGWAAPGEIRVRTHGGWRTVDVPAEGDVRVDMGPPAIGSVAHTVTVVGHRPVAGLAVDMGNPHVVAIAPGVLADLDLDRPPTVTPAFPAGVNVELVEVTGPTALTMRVHERGVGETRSCGTGACAAAVAAATWAGAAGPWTWSVRVPGGDLRVCSDGATLHLEGPAVIVAEGVLDLDALDLDVPCPDALGPDALDLDGPGPA